ncbi:MAG: hypothetical protein IRZ11_04010, partial [Clostridia bacterium]|nr:hypothetical protein [Clostridia bacterium]
MARARRGRAEAADVRVRRARGPAARRGRVAARIPWRRLGTAAAFWLDPARLAFLAFLFALVAGPEMRGLYFPFQLMEATVLVVAALGVFLWRRDRERETARRATGRAAPWWAPWGRFEAAAAAFAGLYLLSGVWAADTQAALWVALLYILSLAGLAFVTQLDPVRRGLVLRAGVAAGSLVAFLGFAAAAGDLPRAHGFTSGTRILSALQYPNTTAAYLVVCLTLALGLAARGPGRPAKGALLGALAGAMVAVFIYTQSRGALLVLPLALLMLWAAAPKGERLRLVMHAMAALLAGGLGALVLSRFWNPSTLSEPHRPGVWLALAVALAAGAALGALAGWLHRRPGPAGLAATLALAALGLAGGAAAFASGRIPAD